VILAPQALSKVITSSRRGEQKAGVSKQVNCSQKIFR
jgi:hypothetical protein